MVYAAQGDKVPDNKDAGVLFKEKSWDSVMSTALTKYIMFEGHSVFTEVQLAKGADIQTHSHAYRSLLRAAIQELGENDADERKVVALYELVWSFCEVLFIEHLPGGCVLPYLLELIRWHFPHPNTLLEEVISLEDPVDHPKYWDTVLSLLFQGQMNEAALLLKNNPSGKILVQLIEEMPLLQNFGGHSLSEFKILWSSWQQICKQQAESGSIVCPESLDVLGVLCGDITVLSKHKNLCQTWYHLMTTALLYTMPTVTVATLHHHAKDMINIFDQDQTALDEILLSAMEFDAYGVLTKCMTHFSNDWWLVAHLADLLEHSGQLDKTELQYGCSLREYLILQYASDIIFNNDLWSLAIDYFIECPKLGRDYLREAIPRIPLETQKKALRVWSVCDKHGLQESSECVCRVMVANAMQNKQLGLALMWSLRAKDIGSVTAISEKILDNYVETSGFSNLDFLDQLGSHKLISKRLMFLGKYREFHQLYKTGNLMDAAELLVSLVGSNLGPPRFQITLLLDSLPLVGNIEKNYINSEQTETLLKGIEDIHLNKHLKAEDKSKIETIRLALITNLAHTYLNEPWDDVDR